MRFRLCVLNEFRNETQVVDCRKFGVVMIIDAFRTRGEHKGYQAKDDEIVIFINYEIVFKTKSKEEARRQIIKILESAPKEFKKDFDELYEYLEIY